MWSSIRRKILWGHGKGFWQDPLTSPVCFSSPYPTVLLEILAVLSPSLSLGFLNLSYTLHALPIYC